MKLFSRYRRESLRVLNTEWEYIRSKVQILDSQDLKKQLLCVHSGVGVNGLGFSLTLDCGSLCRA